MEKYYAVNKGLLQKHNKKLERNGEHIAPQTRTAVENDYINEDIFKLCK